MAINKKNDRKIWYELDLSAIVYPTLQRRDFSSVYRLSVVLKETIDPEILQQAVDISLRRFPTYKVAIRKGLFWRYLETNNRPGPFVQPDIKNPCMPMPFKANNRYLIRIYYRSSSPAFLRHVKEYYEVLLPLLKPLQITEGGNVILMQVENEYGYFADDAAYLETIKKLLQDGGINVPLITSDEPKAESILGGRVEGALPTGNFGSKTRERFEVLREFTQGGPLMCAEFWVGWFDHWGNGGHMTGNLKESAVDLEEMVRLGHVNIYMFIGGTNFGFMNGSNYYDQLSPDVTSYDYDAVLTEAGEIGRASCREKCRL